MTLFNGEQKLETIGRICLDLPHPICGICELMYECVVFKTQGPALCLNWPRLCIDTVYFHLKALKNSLNVGLQLARILRIYLAHVIVFVSVLTAIEKIFTSKPMAIYLVKISMPDIGSRVNHWIETTFSITMTIFIFLFSIWMWITMKAKWNLFNPFVERIRKRKRFMKEFI